PSLSLPRLLSFLLLRRPPLCPTLFPYTTLFRSEAQPSTLYRLLRDDRPVPIHRWKREHVGHIQRFSRQEVIRRTWQADLEVTALDRKSTRLNSSHVSISYAVFCLKKKKKKIYHI